MAPIGNEAFSRVLIDKALEASGWNLLDPRQVQFESFMGRPEPGCHHFRVDVSFAGDFLAESIMSR
jgi:hypothetical protein